jgi:2-haloacid dehalogenase
MDQIRDVVFDLGGVLIDWNPRYLFVRHMGLAPDEVETFLESVATTVWHLGLDAGNPFAEASAALERAHPQHARLIKAYVDGWEHMFAGQFASTVRELHEYARSGFRVHALTNYPGEQIRFLYDRFDFMQAFDTVVVSGLLGFTKPDRRIYDYLLGVLDVPTCLFIDDRPENIAAARAAGIIGIEFDLENGPARLAEFRARASSGSLR